MSQKLEATVHGSRVEDHLRRVAPFGEDEALLLQAADTIEVLRPREITSLGQLKRLRPGAAVLTSDTSDTVVLRSGGRYAAGFINADGGEVTPEILWQFGSKPFTVLWEPSNV